MISAIGAKESTNYLTVPKNRMQEGLKAGLDENDLLDARITAFADDAGDGFD